MTIDKRPICPHLIRQVPEQFSWVDHRLVRERYIDYLSHSAATLYLFLVTVSDSHGLSYYGEANLQKRLSMDSASLTQARNDLIRQQLIAFRKPIYQVLALDPRREPGQSATGPQSIREVLQQVIGGEL